MRPHLAAITVAVLGAAAPAAVSAAAAGDPIVASRREGPIALDGRLEEPAWDLTPVHDGFVQQFPVEGAPPSERTEVRVLYDDRALYVGVVAHDARPGEVRRPLGRRDRAPVSDAITVAVDSMHDGRTAYLFELSAGGVQTDGLLFEDDQFSADWDAVWDGATAAIPDGWSAEFRIPLSVLRFSNRPEQVFGFGVKRVLARRHETMLSVPIPLAARGQVARLGALVGLRGLEPVRALELVPYAAARAALRPRASDGDPARPRVVEPVGDFGLDLRSSVGRGLSLQATLNPDFGQVEADEIIQNLSTFEVFFPEKRPFFTQGMDLFQPVAPPNRASPQQLFYSRRIGLDAPILGAAKLSGSATDTVQLGIVEAFVAGAGSGGPDDAPPRDVRFEPAQPFHVGPASSLPSLAPAPRNFLAGVARWRPSPAASLGATLTSTLHVGPDCTGAEAALDDEVRPPRCDAPTGGAAAVDGSLRSRDGEWFALAQATGSRAGAGAPPRTLADGTVLAPGDLGFGAHAAAGRAGGEPWRFEVHWEYESPTLDLNAAGFQRTQNEQRGRAVLRYVRPGGGGPFHSYALAVRGESGFTTDGSGLHRGSVVVVASEFQLRSFHWFGCAAFLETERWDVRELSEAGVPLRVAADAGGDCFVATDPSRPFSLEVGAGAGRTIAAGPLAPVAFAGGGAKIVVRPHPRLETRVDVRLEGNAWRARYVDADGSGAYLLADLRAPVLSLTLREQVVLTPRLTLQAYAQLFTSYGRYGTFYEARPGADGRVDVAELHARPRPAAGDATDPFAFVGNPDFREGALAVNVVLRWEYRLGSTLFLVYTRGQAEPEWAGDAPTPAPATLRPWALGRGPITDTLLVKWSHFMNR